MNILVLRGRELARREPYSPSNGFSGISGIPAISEFRRISRIFATSERVSRDGALVWGLRAPGGSDLGRCEWQLTRTNFGD